MCGSEPAAGLAIPWLQILIVALLIGVAGYHLLAARPGDGQIFKRSITELEVELHPGDLDVDSVPPPDATENTTDRAGPDDRRAS